MVQVQNMAQPFLVRPLISIFSKPGISRNISVTNSKYQVTPSEDGFYNSEQNEMQKSLIKFIDQEINPYVDEWEAAGQFPAHKLFKKLGNAGFLGVNKPVEYGGLGLDYKYQLSVTETLGKIHCGGISMGIGVHMEGTTTNLSRYGSHYLKSTFLAPSIAGDVVSCIGVTEPQAGSDVSGLKTTARRVGEDLIINGQKMWTTNAWQADWMTLLANTSQGNPHRNKSLICLPMKTPGIHLSKRLDKLGMRSSDTAVIYFEDVRAPVKNIIGEEGMGFTYQMMQFQEERLALAVSVLKPLELILQQTIDYTRQRIAFGQPLLNNQYIHFKLAELATEIEALRALIYRAVELYVSGQDVTQLASMCKLKGGRLARHVTDSCLQFWGGMGFTNEVLVSRFYRDLRLHSIGGGADEVMLGIISKNMGMLQKAK